MRFALKLTTLTLLAAVLGGCGWKMIDIQYRIQGKVLDAETQEPVDGVYIDIADRRDKLDFTITTGTVTGEDGGFDTRYNHQYEKWIWLGLPVFWLPREPEFLFLETYKHGYRNQIEEIESRGFVPCAENCPPNTVAPVLIRIDTTRKKK